MREPEFLPDWYRLLLTRRRAVALQAWGTAALAVGLGIWAFVGQRQMHASEARLVTVQRQLSETGVDLQRLSDIEAVKHELEQQDRIVNRLGVHVPAARMMAALAQLMPGQMALVDLEMRTEEIAAPQSEIDRARGAAPRIGRKLHMNLTGLAPSEEELATFLTQLVAVPYFGEVELVKAEDHAEDSHLMRKFEVTFAMNLDETPGSAVAAADSGSGGAP